MDDGIRITPIYRNPQAVIVQLAEENARLKQRIAELTEAGDAVIHTMHNGGWTPAYYAACAAWQEAKDG